MAINMSRRYINDRFMPDKVIDVIDEAAAIRRVAAPRTGQQMQLVNKQYNIFIFNRFINYALQTLCGYWSRSRD